MKVRDITEAERAEIDAALQARNAHLQSRRKQADTEKSLAIVEVYDEMLALYGANERGSGLGSMFKSQTELDDVVAEERRKKGENRHDDGTADMFGGGSEVGGGIPAGEVVKGVRPMADSVERIMDAVTVAEVDDAIRDVQAEIDAGASLGDAQSEDVMMGGDGSAIEIVVSPDDDGSHPFGHTRDAGGGSALYADDLPDSTPVGEEMEDFPDEGADADADRDGATAPDLVPDEIDHDNAADGGRSADAKPARKRGARKSGSRKAKS